MNKKLLLIIPALLVVAYGCSSGDTPTETVPVAKTEPPKDSMAGAIQSNPNIPPVAKQAITGSK